MSEEPDTNMTTVDSDQAEEIVDMFYYTFDAEEEELTVHRCVQTQTHHGHEVC
jgi:hypothetical protein